MPDLVTVHPDGTFDTGPVPVTTAATYQRLGRFALLGRVITATVQVGPQSVAKLRVSRSSIFDSPTPIVVATEAGGIVTTPAATFPLAAAAVIQLTDTTRDAEWIIDAAGAAAAGGWVRVYGTVYR